MYNFDNYVCSKEKLIKKMISVQEKVLELKQTGIEIDESISKIDNVIKNIKEDKMLIVLVGAFSDGKTSVAAGWIKEKLDNMKISSDESTDEIICYTPSSFPDGCYIVDTPGLFGDKKVGTENNQMVKLADVTKKFISESNMILYVVTAKNPIKESQKDCIKWVLKDLNKLDNTIFVINKMDEVADLTDVKDFELKKEIQIENLHKKLIDCGLSLEEAEKVKIVCISASPDGKGIEEWNEYPEEYLKRSRMDRLDKITNSVLEKSKEELIIKGGIDTLNNEISKILNCISIQIEQINDIILPEIRENIKRNTSDSEKLIKRLKKSKIDMLRDLRALNKKKINAIRAASLDNYENVLEDEIGLLEGREGYRLEDEINDIFYEYFDKNNEWIGKCIDSIETSYKRQDETINNLLKGGGHGIAKGLSATSKIGVNSWKTAIFKGRDILGKTGKVIKFKPWQVTKMANFASKAVPTLGAGIDICLGVYEKIKIKEMNDKFEQNKKELKEVINEMFYDLNKKLEDDITFIDEFAPNYKEIRNVIESDKLAIQGWEEKMKIFKNWKNDMIEYKVEIN